MTILEWLVPNMKRLHEAGVDSPRRDCLVLLEDLLGKDRSWVNAHADFELKNEHIKILSAQIGRRINREPLAYIRGKGWFYGRFFEVNKNVMVPRPESESFITLLKELYEKTRTHRFDAMQGGGETHTEPYTKYGDGALEPSTQQSAKSNGGVSGSAGKQDIAAMSIVDIGTGSGCLAISTKLELPKTSVTAIDIDEKALKVAQKNAKKYNADIKFVHGSLLEPINDAAVIIANLPYVPNRLVTSPEINYEPKTALFSGADGLDHYRQFWQQVNALQTKPAYILVESLEDQHQEMLKLAKEAGYGLEKTEILVQQFRLD